MKPDAKTLYKVVEATWPPADQVVAGPWVLRHGAGGGKRVSAATANARFDPEIDLPAAENAIRIMGQTPLFMLREGEGLLDEALAARGYEIIDPVNLWLCPVHSLTDKPLPRVRVFSIWEPLAWMKEAWERAGIGAARLEVMSRVKGPKTALLGRINDKPAAVAFCGIDDANSVAMVHALEVVPEQRRQGLAQWMMRGAAFWAADWGTEWLAVLCTQENDAANALYQGLGMELVGQYHYRILRSEET
jgi:GNAT superfamily N-acetyltransferase